MGKVEKEGGGGLSFSFLWRWWCKKSNNGVFAALSSLCCVRRLSRSLLYLFSGIAKASPFPFLFHGRAMLTFRSLSLSPEGNRPSRSQCKAKEQQKQQQRARVRERLFFRSIVHLRDGRKISRALSVLISPPHRKNSISLSFYSPPKTQSHLLGPRREVLEREEGFLRVDGGLNLF